MNSLTQNALRALLYEVATLPKPGLVDPIGHSTHPDMDVYIFIDSSASLIPYFENCIAAVQTADDDLLNLFEKIRVLGIEAEERMFTATNGINTHKGAIFSLGIILTAFAYAQKNYANYTLNDIQAIIQQMTCNILDDFHHHQDTAGEKQFAKYHLTGARGEAYRGFPTVFKIGVPYLTQANGTTQEKLINTLLFLAANVEDSNLLKRSDDPQIFEWVKSQIEIFFKRGGYHTNAGKQFLNRLNHEFTKQNLSLGGTADMLIATIFVCLVQGIQI